MIQIVSFGYYLTSRVIKFDQIVDSGKFQSIPNIMYFQLNFIIYVQNQNLNKFFYLQANLIHNLCLKQKFEYNLYLYANFIIYVQAPNAREKIIWHQRDYKLLKLKQTTHSMLEIRVLMDSEIPFETYPFRRQSENEINNLKNLIIKSIFASV